MLVLHAAILEGALVLWGETPPEPSADAPPKRGRARGTKAGTRAPATAPALPFDAGVARLAEALAEAVAGVEAGGEEAGTWVAWLPSVGGRPVASSPLIDEPPANAAEAGIAPWAVSGLRLRADRAADLLEACTGRQTLAPGIVVGKTLEYASAAFRFGAALAARQQFLPGVARQDGSYRARWEPVVAGADAHRLAQLARAMPSACRALGRDAGTPPETSPTAAASAFVAAMVDHLVRSSAEPAAPSPAKPPARRKAARFDSIHDQWLAALRSPEGLMEGDPAELERFAEQVRRWRLPIAVTAAAPFRLCFRLEEPEVEGDDRDGGKWVVRAPGEWTVRYLLQAADDPSLLVPAADAWDPRGRQASVLKRGDFKPREYLLAALGQAASISPRIEESLKTAAPGGCTLDAAGAHEFLTQKSWLLEQAGFGVLLPAWWSRKGTKLRLAARAVVKPPKLKGKGILSLKQILNFKWEVALGDQKLTRSELEALARLKTPLVQVRGQWVQLSAEEIQAALAFWKAKGESAITARQAVFMALGVAKPPGGLAFEGVEATGWLAELLDQLQGGAAFEALDAPRGFHGTLRPYQARGYSWLGFLHRWGFGACLADDMGLGKTIQTLAMVQRDWESSGKDRRPSLLICPMSVVGNWQKEAARFTPDLPVMIHHGLSRIKGPEFREQATRHALVLSSYALLHRDFALFEPVPWAGVILDEAQNIKNPETKQARAARALEPDYRVALTGTPVENHVGDLWSIMEFLNPGLLGTQAEFKRSFHVPIQANRDPEATRKLQRLTGPFLLRRLKTDKAIISDLPDKLEMKVYCTLTKEQASLYEAVVAETAEQLATAEGIQRKGLVLATLAKLKQVCNHPAQFLGDNSAIPGRSGKLARLTEMLDEALEEGDRALIFTQFSEMGAILRRHLQEEFGREVLFLHGGVPKRQRDLMVARFQQGGEGDGDGTSDADAPRLFILTVKAGGTGLNLTRANHVFHFDRWWNPAVENQATDRAFRIGQTRMVQVHKFVCVGTIEEKIDDMIERKQQVAGAIVGTGEDWLTKLSSEELKELFTLRREALGLAE
ncbi:MAG: DEAD/DEAH box helicase [Planctomycetaceae bacterium]|nr:DEAD/DEAH box helicase [Planctomycetaceae bacterium]